MVKKCKNGHWYDPNVYHSCPHCKRDSEKLSLTLDQVEEDDRTVSIAEVDISLGQQLGQIVGDAAGSGLSPELFPSVGDTEDDKTISLGVFGVTGIQPVTGWLVCLAGEAKGRDYRLHSGRNFIGRSASMDVALIDDKTIARDKHCSLVYDPRGNDFYLLPEGGNIVSLNDKIVEDAVKLKSDDIIILGGTKLIFVPYCKEGRLWEEN